MPLTTAPRSASTSAAVPIQFSVTPASAGPSSLAQDHEIVMSASLSSGSASQYGPASSKGDSPTAYKQRRAPSPTLSEQGQSTSNTFVPSALVFFAHSHQLGYLLITTSEIMLKGCPTTSQCNSCLQCCRHIWSLQKRKR